MSVLVCPPELPRHNQVHSRHGHHPIVQQGVDGARQHVFVPEAHVWEQGRGQGRWWVSADGVHVCKQRHVAGAAQQARGDWDVHAWGASADLMLFVFLCFMACVVFSFF